MQCKGKLNFSLFCPLQYCSDVDIMLAGISDGLMTLATEAMLSLNAVMLKIRTLEATYIANKFMDMPGLGEEDLSLSLLQWNSQFVWQIHFKGGGEEDLSHLLLNYTDTPFFYDTSYFFLSERETEINTIKYQIIFKKFDRWIMFLQPSVWRRPRAERNCRFSYFDR